MFSVQIQGSVISEYNVTKTEYKTWPTYFILYQYRTKPNEPRIGNRYLRSEHYNLWLIIQTLNTIYLGNLGPHYFTHHLQHVRESGTYWERLIFDM